MSFAAASTVGEALAAMAGGARPVAGGSDLVVLARQGVAALPGALVAIDGIADLKVLEADDDGLSIGACVNHATLMTEPVIVTEYTALADGAALVGSPATRNVGTLGGNIMNGSPAMDTGAPLAALGASVVLASTSGSRRIGVTDLWTGNRANAAGDDELCVAIKLPGRPARSGSAYVRLECRRAMEIAVVGGAASVTLAGDGSVESGAVALTAVAATVTELTDAGAAMAGKPLDEAAETAGELASETATPITDLRAGVEYRRHTVGVMAKRAVLVAGRRAGGGGSHTCSGQSGGRRRSGVMSESVTLNVNGNPYPVTVGYGRNLLSVLRNEIGLTGTKEGCDDCECGACMVLLDGQPVNSCSYLAVQAAGKDITTVEGVVGPDGLTGIQQAFLESGGVQCGFCTPGMIMSAKALLDTNPDPTDEDIRIGLSGNLCRCTGYSRIISSVAMAAAGTAPPPLDSRRAGHPRHEDRPG